MVGYCCGKTHLTPSISHLGRLPRKENPIDRILFSRPYELEEAEFTKLLNELKNFIFTDKQVSISLWFEACEYYLFLLRREFIEDKETKFIDNLDNLCSTKIFTTSCLENRFHRLQIHTPEILMNFNGNPPEK